MTKAEIILMLYAIAMESGTAYRNMEYLCAALEVPYPPNPFDALVFQKGLQPPVSAALN